MKADKITSDLSFTARYADGTVKDIKEGVLFEFDVNQITMHI